MGKTGGEPCVNVYDYHGNGNIWYFLQIPGMYQPPFVCSTVFLLLARVLLDLSLYHLHIWSDKDTRKH